MSRVGLDFPRYRDCTVRLVLAPLPLLRLLETSKKMQNNLMIVKLFLKFIRPITSYMLITLGGLVSQIWYFLNGHYLQLPPLLFFKKKILLAFLLPLISLNLSDNMIVQFRKWWKKEKYCRVISNAIKVSIAYLSFVILCWIAIAIANGIDTSYLPTIGPDTSQVLGSVLFNYTLANTVPSWVNGTVSHRKICLSGKKNLCIEFCCFSIASEC